MTPLQGQELRPEGRLLAQSVTQESECGRSEAGTAQEQSQRAVRSALPLLAMG